MTDTTDLVDATGAVGQPDGLHVLPCYIVCDESSSMAGESIKAVNEGLEELLETLVDDPVVDQKARVSIIAFNDAAQVLLPLTMLGVVTDIPQCAASGSTSYSSAFRLVKSQIESDIPVLVSEGARVHRPLVFFMSDGAPNSDGWETDHAALIASDFKYRPNVMSFGVAGAQKEVMLDIATTPTGMAKPLAFQANSGVSPGAALKEIMRFIVGTIVTTARGGGLPVVDMQKAPKGTSFIIDLLN